MLYDEADALSDTIAGEEAALELEETQNAELLTDFQVACSHLESLHSHDAVSVICKGVEGGHQADFSDFNDLIC